MKYGDWSITEEKFDVRHLGKFEAIMCQGNGYMGFRAATEEKYLGEVRDFFVAGTYNKFDEEEVTELPNCPDFFGMVMKINGKPMDLQSGNILLYERTLNIRTGEILRKFIWETEESGGIQFSSRRFVSMENRHLTGHEVEIQALDKEIKIEIESGIDGQVTNSGAQHFSEVGKRKYENGTIQLVQRTTESKIDFVLNLHQQLKTSESKDEFKAFIFMDRRRIWNRYEGVLKKYEKLQITRLFTVHTSRDIEIADKNRSLEKLQIDTKDSIGILAEIGYQSLMEESAKEWEEQIWSKAPIKIESSNTKDQLALRFIQYHLAVMTPTHDKRMSIGAKGMSGEGYKGHVFWDTEIFMIPYYTWTFPEVSRRLLEYRYLGLNGARRKAIENGYEGAMFPWEAGWIEDGETTPVWGAADIHTGKPTKIWSGFIEQHITSDVVFAIWQYYLTTGDAQFLKEYGYEIIFEAAKFWISRLEWDEECKLYGINKVVGPDEYKEHVNNNAFTNFTAHWTIKKAIELTKETNFKFIDLETYEVWIQKLGLIKLQIPRVDGVLPQDDSYLSKKQIDLAKYKNQEHVGSLFRDFSLSQVNEIQVSKQADVLLLLYLFGDYFSEKVKKASWEYYEARTLHDSSLSLSTHCVLASDMGNKELAYELFRRAADIDMGPNMESSDHGIHAAAMGGLWQCTINGFGGVRNINGSLRIEPALPKQWSLLEFNITFRATVIRIRVSEEALEIERLSGDNQVLPIINMGKTYKLDKKLLIDLRK